MTCKSRRYTQQGSQAKGPTIFNTNRSSSTIVVAVCVAVKALLAAYPKSRSLGRFLTTHMVKPLNPFIGRIIVLLFVAIITVEIFSIAILQCYHKIMKVYHIRTYISQKIHLPDPRKFSNF